jgi:hypothetical protein
MKNLNKILLIVFSFFMISSCKKSNQKAIIEEISGNYSIQTITITKTDLITDSISFQNSGNFYFENCKIDANKSRGFCDGYYSFMNEDTFNFGYNISTETGETSLIIQPNNSPITTGLNLLGSFEFIEKSNNKLILNSLSKIKYGNSTVKARFILIKK